MVGAGFSYRRSPLFVMVRDNCGEIMTFSTDWPGRLGLKIGALWLTLICREL